MSNPAESGRWFDGGDLTRADALSMRVGKTKVILPDAGSMSSYSSVLVVADAAVLVAGPSTNAWRRPSLSPWRLLYQEASRNT